MSLLDTSLALVPRDGFFFKDGRGWYTSDTNRAGALAWPFPSTLRGTLTTACGYFEQDARGTRLDRKGWQILKNQVLVAAVLPLRRERLQPGWTRVNRVWPVPRDALHRPDGVTRLEPRPRASKIGSLGVLDGEEGPAIESLWHVQPAETSSVPGKPLLPPAWWSDDLFRRWLCGASGLDEVPEALSMTRRTDIKVVFQPGALVARDGGLYAYEVLETLTRTHEWALGVRTTLPENCRGVLSRPLVMGGKRRIAHLEETPAGLWAFPEALGEAFGADCPGIRILLITPGHFAGDWCLPGFAPRAGRFLGTLPGVEGTLILRAAIVPGSVTVSGWDWARNRPKRARRLVPPGSVYFLHKQDGRFFTRQEAESLWLAPLGQDTDDGFGRVVAGVWPPSTCTAQP